MLSAIIQARTNSKRMPSKVLHKNNGITYLEFMIERVKKSKLIDKIIKEPLGGAHQNREKIFEIVGNEITKSFLELEKLSTTDLINSRRNKFEKMGIFNS